MAISAEHLIVRQLDPCGVRGEDVRETETIDRADTTTEETA